MIRAAIIGAGFIGRVHARAIRNAGAEVTAIAGSTIEGSESAARQLDIPTVLHSAEELANRPDIDVVHVCTPNNSHAAYALAALKAGKHVVCEKPLSVNVESARTLDELASTSGLVATVPFIYRFYPTVREMRQRIAGSSEAIRLVHGSYLQDWLSRPTDWTWRVDADIGGPSRAMADIGSHWCDLMEFVTGHRITRLMASMKTAIPQRQSSDGNSFSASSVDGPVDVPVTTEDLVTLMFETNRGAIGALVVSQVSPGRKNRLWIEVDTETAGYTFDQEHPESLSIGGRVLNQELMRSPEALQEEALEYSVLPPGHPQGYLDSFDLFMRDTYRAISASAIANGLPTFRDGLRSMNIVEAVLRSSEDSEWVDVEPALEPTDLAGSEKR